MDRNVCNIESTVVQGYQRMKNDKKDRSSGYAKSQTNHEEGKKTRKELRPN